jgi:hypothetical protein
VIPIFTDEPDAIALRITEPIDPLYKLRGKRQAHCGPPVSRFLYQGAKVFHTNKAVQKSLILLGDIPSRAPVKKKYSKSLILWISLYYFCVNVHATIPLLLSFAMESLPAVRNGGR